MRTLLRNSKPIAIPHDLQMYTCLLYILQYDIRRAYATKGLPWAALCCAFSIEIYAVATVPGNAPDCACPLRRGTAAALSLCSGLIAGAGAQGCGLRASARATHACTYQPPPRPSHLPVYTIRDFFYSNTRIPRASAGAVRNLLCAPVAVRV